MADSLGFPASGEFSILIDAEVLRVTAGNGTTTWAVTRGYTGTTAATHLISGTVYLLADGYADLGDILATMDVPSGTGSADRRLAIVDLIGDVSNDIDAATFRQFYRSPQVSGTETFYLDIRRRSGSLVIAAGSGYCADGKPLDLISVTTLSARDSAADAYVSLGTQDTDWYLQPGYGPGAAGTAWPYEDLVLAPGNVYPTGLRAVKIVGVQGFASVPVAVKRATITEVRERYRRQGGGGPPDAGGAVFNSGPSDEFQVVTFSPYRKGWGIG